MKSKRRVNIMKGVIYELKGRGLTDGGISAVQKTGKNMQPSQMVS
jgi:hypothetical protein